MKTKYIILLLLALRLLAQTNYIYAQNREPAEMLEKLKKANSSKTITYDYVMKSINPVVGQAEDSISGRIYKDESGYLDSNNYSISGNVNGYYFGFIHAKRTATIIKISLLKNKLGISQDQQADDIIMLPDSILLKQGRFKTENLKNGNVLISITFVETTYQNIELEVDKSSMMVQKMKVQFRGESQGDYKRICTLNKIKHHFDKRKLDTGRFFNIQDNKIILNKKYSGYQVNAITN